MIDIADFSGNFFDTLNSDDNLNLVNDGGSLFLEGFLTGADEGSFRMVANTIEFNGTWNRIDDRSANFNTTVDEVDYSGWMNFGTSRINGSSFFAAFIQFQLPVEVSVSVPYVEA